METDAQKDTNKNGTISNGISNGKARVSFSADSFSSVDIPPREEMPIRRQSLIEMYRSRRWAITFLSLTVITLSLTLRMGMSMAIVCMVRPSTNNYSLMTSSNESVRDYDEAWYVDWDSDTQGQVLSSYYYGFPLFCVLGGYAAGKYSGKKVLMIMMITVSLASLGIPYAAVTSHYIVMGLRIVVGLASGGLETTIMMILSKWAPICERSQMIATAIGGQILGNVVTFVFSGIMCKIPYQNGWPFIFYVFGACNLLIMVVWHRVVYDHPEDDPATTKAELAYIIRGRRDSANVKMPDPPWMKIVTSPAFWAILSAHISFGFIFTTIGTFLPLYMNDIMKFDTVLNGVVSSVPFIGRLLGTMVCGYIADKCYVSGRLSTRTIRILFQTIGMVFSAPFLIGLSYLDYRQRDLAVCLLILYWFVQGSSSSGFRANHLDIAPRFAGILNGMTITFSSLASLVSPIITTAIVQKRTKDEWQIVFFICVGVGVAGTLIFDCFARGEEQSWAQDREIDIDIPTTLSDDTTLKEPVVNAKNKSSSQQSDAPTTDHSCVQMTIDENYNGIDNKAFNTESSSHEFNNENESEAHNNKTQNNSGAQDSHDFDDKTFDNENTISKFESQQQIYKRVPKNLVQKDNTNNNNNHCLSDTPMCNLPGDYLHTYRKPLKLFIPRNNNVTESTRL